VDGPCLEHGHVDQFDFNTLVLVAPFGRDVLGHVVGGRREIHHDLERRHATIHQC
jgi:hypothetical protein